MKDVTSIFKNDYSESIWNEVLSYRHTGSDCVEIYIDDTLQKTFDDGTFEAIIAADAERDDKLPCVKPS